MPHLALWQVKSSIFFNSVIREEWFHFLTESIGHGNGRHGKGIGIETDTRGDSLTGRDPDALAVFLLPEINGVNDGAIAYLANAQPDLHLILETQRPLEAARGFYPRPTDPILAEFHVDGKTDGTQEFMLTHLHPSVEMGEVHDARHIGLGELDLASNGKFRRHYRNNYAETGVGARILSPGFRKSLFPGNETETAIIDISG